ncbi:uncharacterized protein [Nicotiana tomentosiformis]|uniref:uncharacterized protein n=1 Tax=Nicotiana tomentosiformis TaxID=4098 RepID=UPI00388CE24A
MVADALSRRAESLESLAYLPVVERLLALDVQALAGQLVRLDILKPSRDRVQRGDARDVTIGDDSVLRIQGRICVPNVDGLRELILEKAHNSRLVLGSSNFERPTALVVGHTAGRHCYCFQGTFTFCINPDYFSPSVICVCGSISLIPTGDLCLGDLF